MQLTTHLAPIIIADSPPEMNSDIAGKWMHTSSREYFYRWFDTRSCTWNTYNGSEWVPATNGNMDFQGTVNAEQGFLVLHPRRVRNQSQIAVRQRQPHRDVALPMRLAQGDGHLQDLAAVVAAPARFSVLLQCVYDAPN